MGKWSKSPDEGGHAGTHLTGLSRRLGYMKYELLEYYIMKS